MWHNDRSGYLEPLTCEYYNHLVGFGILVSSLHILFLGVLFFLLLQAANLKRRFCLKLDLGPGGQDLASESALVGVFVSDLENFWVFHQLNLK